MTAASSPAMLQAEALEVLESDVELMTFFYQHTAACPPHGPFRLYSAITFVARARRRFDRGGGGASDITTTTATTASTATGAAAAAAVSGDAAGGNPSGSVDALLPLPFSEGTATPSSSSLPSAIATTTTTEAAGQTCRRRRLVLAALTTHNALALMERRFNTRHLCGWPLMYVPAEVHTAEVAAVAEEQRLRRKKG